MRDATHHITPDTVRRIARWNTAAHDGPHATIGRHGLWRTCALLVIPLLSLPLLIGACAVSAPRPPSSEFTMPVRPSSSQPLVIGHRGASALLPEHTLAAYARAIEDGADMIEPDLVSTRDGVLVARHENEIGGTTDVAAHPEFAARRTTRLVDGERMTGWFTEDFTLAELKTLRARERLPQLRSTAHDGRHAIATLDEIIALVAEASARQGRDIGLIPEIKHPTYFAERGLAMEARLIETLRAHPYTRRAPVVIQSFETANLRTLRAMISRDDNIRLLQLLGAPHERPYDHVVAGGTLDYRAMMRPEGLRGIATYADGIGPAYRDLDPVDDGGMPRSRLVDDAHAAGLTVTVYTFRPENAFLPQALRAPGGDATRAEAGMVELVRRHLQMGVDAFFTDDPALGRRAVDRTD